MSSSNLPIACHTVYPCVMCFLIGLRGRTKQIILVLNFSNGSEVRWRTFLHLERHVDAVSCRQGRRRPATGNSPRTERASLDRRSERLSAAPRFCEQPLLRTRGRYFRNRNSLGSRLRTHLEQNWQDQAAPSLGSRTRGHWYSGSSNARVISVPNASLASPGIAKALIT